MVDTLEVDFSEITRSVGTTSQVPLQIAPDCVSLALKLIGVVASGFKSDTRNPCGPFKGTRRFGRVGVWRGGFRWSMSVAAPFVWRCLSGSTMAPFPHSPHRTGQADFPHPALGQDLTPSYTASYTQGPVRRCGSITSASQVARPLTI